MLGMKMDWPDNHLPNLFPGNFLFTSLLRTGEVIDVTVFSKSLEDRIIK